MSYIAPLKDMLFNIQYLAGIEQIAQLPGMEDAGFDTAQAVLEEAAKFNEGVLAPLNWVGDQNPTSWKDGLVTATPGFKEICYQTIVGNLKNRRVRVLVDCHNHFGSLHAGQMLDGA